MPLMRVSKVKSESAKKKPTTKASMAVKPKLKARYTSL